jgi:hypothetical protein
VQSRFLAMLFLCSVGLTACSDEQLRAYVDRFDKSVQAASVGVRQKYLGINDLRRTAYLTQVRLQPGLKVESVVEVNGVKEPTGLIQYYSNEYIEARLLAFQALTSYTEGLALMACSDAPARAEQSLKVTGERVEQLGKQIEALTPQSKGSKVTAFATPVARLAGLATRQLLEYVKDRNLKRSLLESQEAVHELSSMLWTTSMKRIQSWRVLSGPVFWQNIVPCTTTIRSY